MVIILKRESYNKLDISDNLNNMAEELSKKYGYTTLQNKLMHLQNKDNIAQIFLKLNIAPLKMELVSKYKAEKVEIGNFCGLNNSQPLTLNIIRCFSIIIFISLFASCVCAFLIYEIKWLLLISWFSAMMWMIGKLNQKIDEASVEKKWISSRIENYKEEIPTFVLTTMLEVGRELRNKKISHIFFVDLLVDRNYYLEIWNESNFEVDRDLN